MPDAEIIVINPLVFRLLLAKERVLNTVPSLNETGNRKQ